MKWIHSRWLHSQQLQHSTACRHHYRVSESSAENKTKQNHEQNKLQTFILSRKCLIKWMDVNVNRSTKQMEYFSLNEPFSNWMHGNTENMNYVNIRNVVSLRRWWILDAFTWTVKLNELLGKAWVKWFDETAKCWWIAKQVQWVRLWFSSKFAHASVNKFGLDAHFFRLPLIWRDTNNNNV